ncbi:MAG: hypothetical protein JXA96_03045 [Sedimentisphaerales bacterium]|nr:hypothetical protein [Sedimentisphaerales bacterium]
MNKICMKLICTLIMFIVLTGCEKNVEKKDSALAIDPIAEKVTMPPEFASLAIDKAGGIVAWGKVRHLQLDCIVTFYNQDAGNYLTEQKCDVFPWSNSIIIAGTESRKSYKWQLSQGKFDILQGTGEISNFKNQIKSSCYAEAIFNLVTAPVRFMDKSFVFTREATEQNIQGRWCYPITGEHKSESSVSNITFYQNKADSMIDMVLLTCADDDTCFLVCGYDYMQVRDAGISIPKRIEIHLADKQGFAKRQLFRIDVSSEK